jgi:hypothetical protein
MTMSDRSKSHSTEPDRTPTAVALAIEQGEPATDLIVVLTGVVQKLPDGTGVFDDLMEARHLLESLPLTTSDFAVAANRIRNSLRFLVSDEPGAALWEVRTLLSWLRRNLIPPLIEPRRKVARWQKVAAAFPSD